MMTNESINERLGELCLVAIKKTFNDLIELPLEGEEGYNSDRSKLALELYTKAIENALDYAKNSDSW